MKLARYLEQMPAVEADELLRDHGGLSADGLKDAMLRAGYSPLAADIAYSERVLDQLSGG